MKTGVQRRNNAVSWAILGVFFLEREREREREIWAARLKDIKKKTF